jgi:hypothetical protein
MISHTHKPSRTVPFVFGLVLGILGTVFLPNYVRPYLPQGVTGKAIVVKGTVTAKQKTENALLLTVDTPDGVLLATFKKKVDEINLLVNEKDAIEFTLPKYMPFIDDPKIIRVVKEQEPAPEQAAPEPAPAPVAKPKEKSTKEVKPRRQVKKPPTAPPAPGAAETKPLVAPPAPGAAETKPLVAPPAPGAAETKPLVAPPAPGGTEIKPPDQQ